MDDQIKNEKSFRLVTRIGTIRKYCSLYGALWQNSVMRDMQFKMNFLLWIFVEFLWFGLQLAFVAVIYSHTDRIATWSKWEVVLLTGGSQFIQQVFHAIFLNNIVGLSEHIRTGRLDFMLLLPINSRFLISLRTVDLGSLVGALGGLVVMAYACYRMNLVPSFAQCFGFGVLCFVGILIHYSLMFLLGCISFVSVKAQGIVRGYYNLFNIARLPDGAFQGMFRIFFTFFVPMLLVSNVPVKLLANKLSSPLEIVSLIAMACFCYLVSEFGWRFAIKRYTSASS
ncbi:ABC-2 family transporter protein [bacterium]|jgi:ABC-2 type transport system permease protein|nr:ABC-2 family transporter protein [bacterium]MDA7645256.1 ABC-2 family transporter protein [bacterium]MDA7680347.1 ABC-2 family transporter protein [bacterium]